MKKLIIFLLFFGFSFGQLPNPQDIQFKDYNLVGNWEQFLTFDMYSPEDKNLNFIFLTNGTGYLINEEGKSFSLIWDTSKDENNPDIKFKDSENTHKRRKGSLILTFEDYTWIMEYDYFTKEFTNDSGINMIYPDKYKNVDVIHLKWETESGENVMMIGKK